MPERLIFDVEALRRYLTCRLTSFKCEQGGLRGRQFSHGESNPTYHLHSSTSGQEYVLRRRPPGKLLPGAHRVSQWALQPENESETSLLEDLWEGLVAGIMVPWSSPRMKTWAMSRVRP